MNNYSLGVVLSYSNDKCLVIHSERPLLLTLNLYNQELETMKNNQTSHRKILSFKIIVLIILAKMHINMLFVPHIFV